MFSFSLDDRLRDQALLENLGPNGFDYECKHESSPNLNLRYSHNKLDVFLVVPDGLE